MYTVSVEQRPADGAAALLPQEKRTQVTQDEGKVREEVVRLWQQLDAEYVTSWADTHQDIIDFIQPNSGQFWPMDTNRGYRQDARVVNNIAEDAAGKLAAAMDTGITSEAREWFIVGVEDQKATEDRGIREYCHELQTALYAFISRIGWYSPNRNVFSDLVGPAIGLMLIEEDPKTVARCTHVPIGQYRVAADSAGEVNLVIRRFLYTAAQMVEEFGEDRCSEAVLKAVNSNLGHTTKFTVIHLIRERRQRNPRKRDAKNMPWESTWVEVGLGYMTAAALGTGQSSEPVGPVGILRQSGYNECPFYCPRWDAIGQDAYGKRSPGWRALGDTKSLQDVELGDAMTLAKIMDPPLNVPAGLSTASLLPGARNPLPDNVKVKAEPTVVIPPDAAKAFEVVIGRLEQRISRAMYGDILFLLSGDQRLEPRTAEEIRGKKEERLLQLGGVFARVARELRKVLKRIAAIAQRAGLLPEPPPQMTQNGIKLKVDFVNPLITAQKAIGFTAIQQVIALAIQLGEAKKAGADKLDVDEILDTACDMLGVKPDILYSDEEVAQMRAQVQQQLAQQQAAKSLPEAAGAIDDLSNADPEKLRGLLQRFGPNAQAEGAGPGA